MGLPERPKITIAEPGTSPQRAASPSKVGTRSMTRMASMADGSSGAGHTASESMFFSPMLRVTPSKVSRR
jgi:hypothetical protein